jgi:GTP pyrophosphokinase
MALAYNEQSEILYLVPLTYNLKLSVKAAISTEEMTIIKRAYARMVRSIKVDISEEDKQNIKQAFDLAVDAHAPQRRKSGEPYVLHPIEVAHICAVEIGLGPTALICALLHDVVEDTRVTQEEINTMFGPKIGTIVDGLTKLDGSHTKDSPQAENFKKVLSTLVEDVRVVLIKMADRLHNLRTIGSMPRAKQLKIAAETMYIYAPLAHRLGLYNIKTEFQDLCMKITEPEKYQELEEKISDSKNKRKRYIAEFIKPIKAEIEALGIPYRILGRLKSVHSIWNKIKTKNVPFEEIYDLFAIRIIIDSPSTKEKKDCWQVYSVVTDVYKPIPERLKDWITTPKSNGYESLHTTVIGPKGNFIEVQIRSERMDEIAERGFAAHWKYKGAGSQPDVYDHWLDNIRSILDSDNSDATEFLSDFKTNLFKEEVYVYTPKGDMRVLPKGATALDFAFSIHSDVGSQCTAAKVNNKLVPLGYKLQNGDRVSVITSSNQKPKDDWLKIVITGKARSKIRSALKEEKGKKGIFGKEALERKLKNLKVDYDQSVDFLVNYYGFKHRPDLYFAIASDEIDLTTFKKFDIVNHVLTAKPAEKEVIVEKPKSKRSQKVKKEDNKPQVYINDEPGAQYNYSFANCCKPVQGDKIFGYVTAGSGIKVHRINCPNATHLMAHYGYRMVKAEWSTNENSSFIVSLLITGVDDGPGVIERLTSTLSSKLGINIRSFSIEGKEGYFEGKISLLVLNTEQLQFVINKLKELDGISQVTRIE